MDDQDQTQINPLDASARQTQSRSRRKQPTSQPAPGQQVVPPVQAMGALVEDSQQAQAQPTTNVLPEQTLLLPARRKQQQTRPQAPVPPMPMPQAIRFAGRESTELVTEPILQPSAPRQRFRRTRRWLRSRTGRIIIPLLTLLIGLALGLTSVIWYGLSGEGPLVAIVPAASGNLVVDANQSFVSQLIRNNLSNAGLPGKVQNVKIELEHGAAIIIQGDDAYPFAFITITKHFTVNVQPYVQHCVLQVRITHADLAGIPVTTFVQTFQNKINQQLAKKPAGLPSDFTYCTVGVSTEPGGMYITYQAVPVTK